VFGGAAAGMTGVLVVVYVVVGFNGGLIVLLGGRGLPPRGTPTGPVGVTVTFDLGVVIGVALVLAHDPGEIAGVAVELELSSKPHSDNNSVKTCICFSFEVGAAEDPPLAGIAAVVVVAVALELGSISALGENIRLLPM